MGLKSPSTYLFFLCALLHAGTKGLPIRVVQEQVAAIMSTDNVGAAHTTILTLAGPVWVKETPDEAAAALAAAKDCK